MRLFWGIGGLPLMFTLRSSSAQRKKRNARGTSCTPMAPDAGPFSCSPEAFPARLTSKDVARSATELENQNSAVMMMFHFKPDQLETIIMNTRETLILKALECKKLHNGADNGRFVDALLDQNPEAAEALTKNVCARLPIGLVEDMEGLSNLIDLNKREMITLALIDFLDKAKATLDEFDAWPKGEVLEG